MTGPCRGTCAALLILLTTAAGVVSAQGLRTTGSAWGADRGWRFLPSAGLAYDSFGQKYVLADNDTLDLVDELSGRFTADLEHRGRTEFRLRNTFGYGQQAVRNDVQMWL